MPLNRIEFIDIYSLDDVYRQLAAQQPLPEHFGQNLDALYDVLTCDLEGPLTIIWHKHDASAVHLGHENYTGLLAALRDAAANRPNIELSLE